MFDPLDLLLEMESEITDNMTRLLAKDALESASWQALKLLDLGLLKQANIVTVEKYLEEINAGMAQYFETIGVDAIKDARIPGLSDILPSDVSPSIAMVWKIWETQTMNQFKQLGMTLIDEAQTVYIQIVYKTAAKMLAGASTLRVAIAETASEWLREGIPGLVDKAGRNWSVEAYAQMVLRSNERMTVTSIQDSAFDEYDIDLVEISAHMGARPLCAPYQGRVFSRSGRSSKYPALSSTSIGQKAGLFGINCGHRMYAYNPAAGKTYKPYGAKENADAYKKSQKQRYYERQIRTAKRNLSIAENITKDQTVIAWAKQNLANAQERMRDFIKESDRTRRYDREQIY